MSNNDDHIGWNEPYDDDEEENPKSRDIKKQPRRSSLMSKHELANWLAMIKADNLCYAKELEVTLLELHIHQLVEDEIQKNSFLAAASSLEAQEFLQRVAQKAKS